MVGTPGADEIQIDGEPRKLTAVKDVHNVVQGDVRQFETKTGETVYTSEIPIPIALGGRLDLVSVYPVETGAVSELDTLVAQTDWTANTAADGTGNNRTSQVDIDIELMDFNEIHITITYPTMAGTQADTLYVRDLTIEGTVLTVTTSLQVTREDTVSKQRYRPKTRGLRNTWIRSVADMENRADAILDAIASPERRVQLDYLVEDWAEFLSLDLSDRVRVVLPTVESDAFIESIGLSIRRGGAYYSTVNLSLTSDVQAMAAQTAPSFADDTGTPQTWTRDQATTSITVPAATGTPTPTYSAVGTLPTGISFDSTTRVLSGTPTAAGSGTITIRATNTAGTDDWTVDYTTTAAADVAPSFADDTGTAKTWTQNQAIASVTVPSASGTPAPTYAAVGALPTGINFNSTTRVLSGTPTAAGSGTITIQATNSEGTDDWTVEYTTTAVAGSASVTVNLGAGLSIGNRIIWAQNVDLGATFDADGMEQELSQTDLYYSGGNAGRVILSISGQNNRFTSAFEATGQILFESSDGEVLEITIGNADVTEPYDWTPVNSAEVIAFGVHVAALTDRSVTLTLTN